MGQRPSCCHDDEVQEVPKVEVVHHVHHRQEFETNSWKTCLPIDRIADTSQNAELEIQNEKGATTTSSSLSLAQCRLQKMDHPVVDRDILRGISLRESFP